MKYFGDRPIICCAVSFLIADEWLVWLTGAISFDASAALGPPDFLVVDVCLFGVMRLIKDSCTVPLVRVVGLIDEELFPSLVLLFVTSLAEKRKQGAKWMKEEEEEFVKKIGAETWADRPFLRFSAQGNQHGHRFLLCHQHRDTKFTAFSSWKHFRSGGPEYFLEIGPLVVSRCGRRVSKCEFQLI